MASTDGDRLAGVLLGTAVGDALGLPAENLAPAEIRRLFGRVDRFRLLGRTGYVSDDTEHTAFVAQALIEQRDDPAQCARAFARRLRGWVLRLPFGVGFGTLRACLKLCCLVPPTRSGVRSAGNGAAMRAAIVGVVFAQDAARRRSFGEALARTTHTDPRAVAGALWVAEAAACLSRGEPLVLPGPETEDLALRERLEAAAGLVAKGAGVAEAARELGTTGFVLHTVPFAAFLVARFGDSPRQALEEAVAAGGDTDTVGAIVGALAGARHGLSGLPADLVQDLEDGPLGRGHLLALARALLEPPAPAPRFSGLRLLLRNALLVPVLLGHVARRVGARLLPGG